MPEDQDTTVKLLDAKIRLVFDHLKLHSLEDAMCILENVKIQLEQLEVRELELAEARKKSRPLRRKRKSPPPPNFPFFRRRNHMPQTYATDSIGARIQAHYAQLACHECGSKPSLELRIFAIRHSDRVDRDGIPLPRVPAAGHQEGVACLLLIFFLEMRPRCRT